MNTEPTRNPAELPENVSARTRRDAYETEMRRSMDWIARELGDVPYRYTFRGRSVEVDGMQPSG